MMDATTVERDAQGLVWGMDRLNAAMHMPPTLKLAHCGEICDGLKWALCHACDHPNPKECREHGECLSRIEARYANQYPCASCDPRTPEQIAEDKGCEEFHRRNEDVAA